MLRNWGTLVLLLLATPVMAFAQSGKIAGQVLDAETGEPLPGANVFIEGTTLGAAVDPDGEYEIFEVPPGNYTLVASFTGFATERRSDVEIVSGITNRQDFSLGLSTLELDVVEVTAERNLINATATNAVRRVSQEMIQALPSRDVETYYAIQPGVTVLNDEVYIRGGRPDETEFLLEGISSRSLIGTDNVVAVIPEALEEVQVFAGGYSAELGGANAGIIQQVLRTGGPTLSGLVQYETDEGAGVFDTHSYGYNDVTFALGGPLVWKQHRFFVAVNRRTSDNYDPIFWTGANLGQPFDQIITDDQAPSEIEWEDGELPGASRPREQLKVNGTVSLDFSPLRVRMSYARVGGDRTINDAPIYNMFNQERVTQRDDFSHLGNLQATYFLSNDTYLEASAGMFRYSFQQYDPLFDVPEANGNGSAVLDALQYYDRDAVGAAFGDNTELAELYTQDWRGRYTAPEAYRFNAFEFLRPGMVDAAFTRRDQRYYNGALSLTSQIGNHYVVTGGNFTRWTLRDYALSAGGLAQRLSADEDYQTLIEEEDPEVARHIRLSGYGGYGYDEFFNEVDDGINAPKRPTTGALFLNDRIEFNDIIVNAGLRLDMFDMDLYDIEDPESPPFDKDEYLIHDSLVTKASVKTALQPRLGISFPVTERTAFHLQYGKFAQMPDMFYVYDRVSLMALALGGQNFISNPFAWDLDPIRSTQYEIGIGHQFNDFAAFDVTAFYRKTEGQLEIQHIDASPTSDAGDYNIFANGDFAIARGIEATLRTRRIGNFMAMLNYTLTDAKGTNAEPGGQISALENGTAPPSLIQPLSFEERHRGAAVLDYRTGNTGNPLTEEWTVNLLYTFHSGHRFTSSTGTIGQRDAYEGGLLTDNDPRSRIPLEPLNSSTTPWFFNTDLRLEKGFAFGPASATVFGYVQNIFNRRNPINVYSRTGSAENDGFLTDPSLSRLIVEGQGQGFVDYYQAINLENRQHYMQEYVGEDLLVEPRQIRLGVRVDF